MKNSPSKSFFYFNKLKGFKFIQFSFFLITLFFLINMQSLSQAIACDPAEQECAPVTTEAEEPKEPSLSEQIETLERELDDRIMMFFGTGLKSDDGGQKIVFEETDSMQNQTKLENIRETVGKIKALCEETAKGILACCKDSMRCLADETNVDLNMVALGVGAGAGAAVEGDQNVSRLCNALSGASSAVSATNLGFGAYCMWKVQVDCFGACSIQERADERLTTILGASKEGPDSITARGTRQNMIGYIDEIKKDLETLKKYTGDLELPDADAVKTAKDAAAAAPENTELGLTAEAAAADAAIPSCPKSRKQGMFSLAQGAIVGGIAAALITNCEKWFGEEKKEGEEEPTPPEEVQKRVKRYCEGDNPNGDYCRICNPTDGNGDPLSAEDYNTQVLQVYSWCQDEIDSPDSQLVDLSHFAGGGRRLSSNRNSRSQREPNQVQKNSSHSFPQYGFNPASGGRGAGTQAGGFSDLGGIGGSSGKDRGTTIGEDGAYGGQNQSSSGGSSSSHFGGIGGGNSGGGFFSGRSKKRRGFNLRDFLPGRKKDPKKTGNTHLEGGNLFFIHSKTFKKVTSKNQFLD